MNALEIKDLFEQESPVGQLHVRLEELGITVEREWWIDEGRTAYIVLIEEKRAAELAALFF